MTYLAQQECFSALERKVQTLEHLRGILDEALDEVDHLMLNMKALMLQGKQPELPLAAGTEEEETET